MTGGWPVKGTVQHYAWGDTEFLPRLLGQEPDGRPWAELWLGTHPRGQTRLRNDRPLINETGSLPYLLKVLTAAKPLSMQCHPDAARAQSGFDEGVYGDPFPKPELLLALTPFQALCGIRPPAATDELLSRIGASDFRDLLVERPFVEVIEELYRRQIDSGPIIDAVLRSGDPTVAHIADLQAAYPDDPSVVVALLLNHVTLEPGQALHLTAGNLHAYLCGSGVELMGASDNVVRGGLTVKPVDVDELLRIIDPTPLDEPVMLITDGRYPLPEAGVALVRVDAGDIHLSTGHELAVSLNGDTVYLPPGDTWQPDVAGYVVVVD